MSENRPRAAPALAPWDFDPSLCRVELDAFEQLLSSRPELSERRDILPFFRAHPHLCAFLGSYHPNAIAYDRLGIEVPLFGSFIVDAVTGDWDRKAFCFIEFEDAMADSIFMQQGRRTSEWAPRFDHGFSQIVDWLWLLDDQEHTLMFEALFGARQIDVTALLIVGRDSGLSDGDRRRLVWRRNHVVVNSRHVYCYTFDELLRNLRRRLDAFTGGARST